MSCTWFVLFAASLEWQPTSTSFIYFAASSQPVRSQFAAMAQSQAQRTLYCAYSNDLTDVISIDCTPDKDFISHVQQRVWETDREIRELLPRPGLVRLFCPKGTLEHGVTEENIAPLSFHQRVSATFPKSGDEHIDVIIKRPEMQQPTQVTTKGKIYISCSRASL